MLANLPRCGNLNEDLEPCVRYAGHIEANDGDCHFDPTYGPGRPRTRGRHSLSLTLAAWAAYAVVCTAPAALITWAFR